MIKIHVIVLLLLCFCITLISSVPLSSSVLPKYIKELYNNKLKNSTITLIHEIEKVGNGLNFAALKIFDERKDSHDSLSKISSAELNQAYAKCFETLSMSKTKAMLSGWRLIHSSNSQSSEPFWLLKKKEKNDSGGFHFVYLMIGEFKDISARAFLTTQFDPSLRFKWDLTCKEMITEGQDVISNVVKGTKDSADQLYYRTRWPWPLKDRDYVLARRVQHLPALGALVLVSKSTESKLHPIISNVIRVDRYWCHSTIFTTNDDDRDVDKPGMKFVTYFCDDQRIPLPNKLVEILAQAGERLVPESMSKLHQVALASATVKT